MSSFRQLMMRKKGRGGDIPARYEVVDYISMVYGEPYNGSLQYFYISTGLYGNTVPTDNYSCEVTFVSTAEHRENAFLLNAWNINSYFLLHYNSNAVWHGVSGGGTKTVAIDNDTKYTIKVDMQNGNLIKDGVASSFIPGSCGTAQIYLFGCPSFVSTAWYHSFRGKIYGIKFYAPNGNEVRNYVPVYDTVSAKYGFYETIEGTFKGNEGTIAFSGGND